MKFLVGMSSSQLTFRRLTRRETRRETGSMISIDHLPWVQQVMGAPLVIIHLNRPGKHTKKTMENQKIPIFLGKSTISMAIFNSYVKWPEGNGISHYIYIYILYTIYFWGTTIYGNPQIVRDDPKLLPFCHGSTLKIIRHGWTWNLIWLMVWNIGLVWDNDG